MRDWKMTWDLKNIFSVLYPCLRTFFRSIACVNIAEVIFIFNTKNHWNWWIFGNFLWCARMEHITRFQKSFVLHFISMIFPTFSHCSGTEINILLFAYTVIYDIFLKFRQKYSFHQKCNLLARLKILKHFKITEFNPSAFLFSHCFIILALMY